MKTDRPDPFEGVDMGYAWIPNDVMLALHAMVPRIDSSECGAQLLAALRKDPDQTISQLTGEFGGNLRRMLAFYESKVDAERAKGKSRRENLVLVPRMEAALSTAIEARTYPAKNDGAEEHDDDGGDDRMIPLDPDAYGGGNLFDKL